MVSLKLILHPDDGRKLKVVRKLPVSLDSDVYIDVDPVYVPLEHLKLTTEMKDKLKRDGRWDESGT